jgi:rubrerythrin
LTHIDPSWCARINAHRHARPEQTAPSAPASEAPPVEREPAEGVPSSSSSGSPFRLREVPREHVCECCGTVMFDHNCKIVCPNCGYKRDCSDP